METSSGEVRVVRAGGLEEAALGEGWTLRHRSWGARLRLPEPFDPAPFAGFVRAAAAPVVELGPEHAAAVAGLQRTVLGDFPGGPATVPSVVDEVTAAELWDGGRVFGVHVTGRLVAVTALRVEGDLVETEFTSVARPHRGRGLATAVKAASILALAADGHRVFATGGADENAASIRMNERLGYRVEERWHTWAAR